MEAGIVDYVLDKHANFIQKVVASNTVSESFASLKK